MNSEENFKDRAMVVPAATILPYILNILRYKPHLCETVENISNEVAAQLTRENTKFTNVFRAVQRALGLGEQLGILTFSDNVISVSGSQSNAPSTQNNDNETNSNNNSNMTNITKKSTKKSVSFAKKLCVTASQKAVESFNPDVIAQGAIFARQEEQERERLDRDKRSRSSHSRSRSRSRSPIRGASSNSEDYEEDFSAMEPQDATFGRSIKGKKGKGKVAKRTKKAKQGMNKKPKKITRPSLKTGVLSRFRPRNVRPKSLRPSGRKLRKLRKVATGRVARRKARTPRKTAARTRTRSRSPHARVRFNVPRPRSRKAPKRGGKK